jgi:hypothetical protein
MKIAASNIELSSSHAVIEQHQRREQLALWRNGEQPRALQTTNPTERLRALATRLTTAFSRPEMPVRAMAPAPAKAQLECEEEPELEAIGDLKVNLIRLLVQEITGKEIKLATPKEFQTEGKPTTATPQPQGTAAAQSEAPPRAGWGLVYDYYESHHEREATRFSAEGIIRTQDGKEINFQVELNMSREFFTEQSLSLRAGDALKDPLILNFHGTAAELTEDKFSFDLDADGRQDQISFVGPGSGFLAIDHNHDGLINDGSELFGPTTGDGFKELSAYDLDSNNWIDENDDIYSRLRIWSKDAEGKDQLIALGQQGVGAIYLGHIDTPFMLAGQNNEQLGQIQSSGLFLEEGGGIGTIQHIDLVV